MIINKKKIFLYTGAIISISVIAYIIFAFVASSQLAQARQAIADAGYPTTAQEIIPQKVADKDNAAKLYEAANILLISEDWENMMNATGEIEHNHFNDQQMNVIGSFIQRPIIQQALFILNNAADMKQCQFIDDFSNGPMISLPHFSWEIASFHDTMFQYHFQRKEFEKAQDHLELSISYTQRFTKEPFLVCHLLFVRCMEIAITRIRLLSTTNLSLSEKITTALDSTWIQQNLIAVLHGERLLIVEWFFDQRLNESDRKDILGDGFFESSLYALAPLRDLNHADFLNFFLHEIKRCESPYTIEENKILFAPYNFLSRQIIAFTPGARILSLNCQTNMIISQAGISALAYKKAHGHFPDTLDEKYIDLFNQNPLLYTHSAQGFTISSVGSQLDGSGNDVPQWTYSIKDSDRP